MADPLGIAADILDPPVWSPEGRPPLEPHQIPPDELPRQVCDLWLLEAGRGAGKTEACARYFAGYMRQHPGTRALIIAPTFGDAVEACITGPSGLLVMDPAIHWLPSAPGGAKVSWSNGSEALVLGTHTGRDVERLRAGGNRGLVWWEEMAANPQLQAAWDQAAFGLRLGDYPHAIASTTPRNKSAYRAIRKMPGTKLVTGISLFQNPHLGESYKQRMVERYEGTRLGRQELYGELLEDIEGALWTRRMLESARWEEDLPDMAVIVVAVDPAATSAATADDTGIVVVGLGIDGYGYVLEDCTCHLPPDGWGTRAVRAWARWHADAIIGETNNGGEMVEHVISTAAANLGYQVHYEGVNASRGKATRAQPVAMLYGDGQTRPARIRHVPGLVDLEDQLSSWVPGEDDSPDRLDALVWGATKLFFEAGQQEEIVQEYQPVQIGADL